MSKVAPPPPTSSAMSRISRTAQLDGNIIAEPDRSGECILFADGAARAAGVPNPQEPLPQAATDEHVEQEETAAVVEQEEAAVIAEQGGAAVTEQDDAAVVEQDLANSANSPASADSADATNSAVGQLGEIPLQDPAEEDYPVEGETRPVQSGTSSAGTNYPEEARML